MTIVKEELICPTRSNITLLPISFGRMAEGMFYVTPLAIFDCNVFDKGLKEAEG